jgi:ubiquitin-conjugating enzyme E2 J2
MVEKAPTSGSLESTDETKRRLAIESKEFNLKDKLFCELFPELAEQLSKELEQEQIKLNNNNNNNGGISNNLENNNNNNNSSNVNNVNNNNNNINNTWLIGLLNNLVVMIGLALLAFMVKYVLFN